MKDADADDAMQTRVLVLAPTARDAAVTRVLLGRAGLRADVYADARQLSREVGAGAGAALLTESALSAGGVGDLLAAVGGQPAWSEFPFVLLMRGAAPSPAAAAVIAALRNVTLLERPAPMRTVASAVQAAVRSRRRQYQIRDQIEQIRRGEQERAALLEGERSARVEAERANRLKDDFLATVSHELRTPLNAILGWAQLLRRRPDDPGEVVAGLEVIERNARQQAQLVGDLLDMSRVASGKLRLDLRTVDVGPLVDAAAAAVYPTAAAKGVEVRADPAPQAQVLADPDRLQQVFWNLLTNAIKFTPAGGRVTVTTSRRDGAVAVAVADTGRGMTAAFLPHVFERFRQADSSTTRAHGGLGLGLALVKQLVDLHGGRVEALSGGEGRGATFIVTLPAARPARGDGAAVADGAAGGNQCAADVDLAGVRVLVVDDDADARALVRRLLTDCRADVTTAASAADGLRLLAGHPFDVLLSDIGMPEMDGYEFIRHIRAAGPAGAGLPAAALTAFVRPEDRERALRSGFQAQLPKPVDPAALVRQVASLAARRAGPPPADDAARTP